nr:hypothetical protein [Tanacetum cinerariifolium]
MAPLTFADTHNMVAFLSKSDAEDVIQRDIYLDDADGVECLSNEDIFVELAQMGYKKPPPKLTFYKRTAWNEFSRSMASAVICLATEGVCEYEEGWKSFSGLTLLCLLQCWFNHIYKLHKKEKKLKCLGGCIQTGGKIEAIDVDGDITLVDVQTQEEVVTMDVEPQGRINQEDVNASSKGVNAAEPTVFDDEEVTMTMAQTLIKLKAKKAKLLDEQIAQKLHDEEVQKATARDKQEKDDMEKA